VYTHIYHKGWKNKKLKKAARVWILLTINEVLYYECTEHALMDTL